MSTLEKTTLALAAMFATGAALAQTTGKKPPLPEFALIFRISRTPDPAQVQTRNSAARDWALGLRRDGTLHTASPLEDGGSVVSQRGVTALSPERAIASVLVIEARDLESAVALAKGHPGLAFGTEIEVRPVKAVPLPR
jgi:hypothetical protein